MFPLIKDIQGVQTLYRVGHAHGSDGLWYNKDALFTGQIHTLADGAAGLLPMGFHPVFSQGGKAWRSVTSRVEDIALWFSEKDMRELLQRGYQLEEYEVSAHRHLTFKEYAHEVFHEGVVLTKRILDPMLPYQLAG